MFNFELLILNLKGYTENCTKYVYLTAIRAYGVVRVDQACGLSAACTLARLFSRTTGGILTCTTKISD